MRKKFIFISSIVMAFALIIGLFFFRQTYQTYDGNFLTRAESAERHETKRVWLKITSSSWQLDNAETQIHYFNDDSSITSIWPGELLTYDLANEAYYYDLPIEMNNYMFTRVDLRNNYLNAKTADLKYSSSINNIYIISGEFSSSNEVMVNGSFSSFIAKTTDKVSNFITLLDDGNYICNYAHTLKELNYYNYGLTTFEAAQYDEIILYDQISGKDRIMYLENFYQIKNETVASLRSKLNSDKEAINIISSTKTNFELPLFGELGSYITWTSSRLDVLRILHHQAKIISPISDTTLTLTATLVLFGEESQKEFTLVVLKDETIESTSVTWTINLPFNIPSGRQLVMGSDLNAWTPSNTTWGEVTKVNDQQYLFKKTFIKEGLTNSFDINYKWVLYSSSDANMWYGVENAPNNQNRSRTISYANESQTFTDTISSFENITSGGGSTVQQGKLTITSVGGRTIRIYTPSNYDTNTSLRYPVIYMHDGQNLFETSTSFAGEWEVDEAIENLMVSNNWSGMIAVGIDNTTNRMGEYMYPTGYISYNGYTPTGDTYMNLIVNTIKPYIDSNYRTLSSRENTLIGGSSMGGLISFFGGLHHLNTFGTIMAFSTSTQLVSNGGTNIPATLNSLNQDLLKNTKFFLYVGTSSDGTFSWPETYKGYLTAKGVPNNNVQTYLGQGHSHNEYAWRVHFPIALKWSMGFGL